ncbi:MAG: SprT family zinc-dependent metalloprotease [Bacteroidota bacterium]|nr:SprT family zinc-dependent metalloprotease [Bacteroidota bacterium]
MEHIVNFGSSRIIFSIQYSNRKTLTIVVLPAGSVLVKAPEETSLEAIKEKVHKRASWILKQQLYFRSFGERTPERKFVSGESHLYLGRQYLLRVKQGKPESIKYKGRYFEIVCSHKSKAKDLMNEWYRIHAKMKFVEIAEPIIQRFKRYDVEPTDIYIQEMNNRWGSCTNSGKMILNTVLIKAPRPCIEYVITHELCHLVYRNHTKAFYHLLSAEMPDWEKWKNKLEKILM